jgi:hypothetical protein
MEKTHGVPIEPRKGEPLVQAASRAAKQVRLNRRKRLRKNKRTVLDRNNL